MPREPGTFSATRRFVVSAPYYQFRPRSFVSARFFVGYPAPFPYSFFPPSGYGAYACGYSLALPCDPYGASGNYDVVPQQDVAGTSMYLSAETGGISFEVSPATAAVVVDGIYVGTVAEFSSTTPPLVLGAGKHHIEVRAPGYQTVSFDVTTMAGQVIPYRGALVPIR